MHETTRLLPKHGGYKNLLSKEETGGVAATASGFAGSEKTAGEVAG